MQTSDLIQPRHLARHAAVYVRQSSPHQVLTNTESQRLQYAMTRRAGELGFAVEQQTIELRGLCPRCRPASEVQ